MAYIYIIARCCWVIYDFGLANGNYFKEIVWGKV